MELRRIRHFVGVVDARGFQRAAEALHLTQPALSLSVRQLEDELGVRLLDRTPAGVLPTPRGELLYSHAVALLRDAENARAVVAGFDAASDRPIRFGVGKTVSTPRLATAMQRLKAGFPAARPCAISGTYASLVPRLRTGELDFLLTRLPDESRDPELDHRPLLEDPHVVVAAASHPLASLERVRLARLLEHPWVYGEPLEEVIPNWAEPFRAAGIEPPRPTLHADAWELVRAILLSSDALTVMPSELVADDVELGRLVRLKIPRTPWRQRVGLTIRRHRTRPPVVEVFVDELAGCFRARASKVDRRG
jgi:DNA-binding transcriptional LysR family regulator